MYRTGHCARATNMFIHLHIHLVCVIGLQYNSILPQWNVTYDTNNDKKNIVDVAPVYLQVPVLLL